MMGAADFQVLLINPKIWQKKHMVIRPKCLNPFTAPSGLTPLDALEPKEAALSTAVFTS